MSRWLATTALAGATLVALSAPSAASETQSYTYDALGRLTAVQYSGSINNGQAHSLCYDPAGNRSQYKSSSAGALASCGSAPAPSPTPTPTPTSNDPPVTTSDTLRIFGEWEAGTKNVVSNDTDPNGDYPLALVSVQDSSGYAFVHSSTEVGWSGSEGGTYYVTYTVKDSRGATATGSLRVEVPRSCGDLAC